MEKIITVTFPGKKRVNAQIGDIVIRTDQTPKNGGDGSAPEPFQLFLTSIATCAGLYALEFCRARDLSLEGLALRMTCDFNPEKKLYTSMTIDLTLPADFPEKFVPAIIRSMDLCTVKKHILHPPEFKIRTSR